jgi:radical SAM superfamily enzyme YgiQ (UPF0313 family)
MKKILLINPWIHDFSAYDFWIKPLGLLYIASFLERYGYKIEFINCLDGHLKEGRYGCGKFFYQEIEKPPILKEIPRKFKRYGIPKDEFKRRLENSDPPGIVGITSFMTYWYPGVFECIQMVKEQWRDVPVVLGGIYPSFCYEHALKNSGADFIVKGEGISEMLRITGRIFGDKRLSKEVPIELDEMPFPSYRLLGKISSVGMITSLGCPFRCSYCGSAILRKGFYQRSPWKVFLEIKYYLCELGVRDIAFYDDALLINVKGHIEPILREVIKETLDVRFHTPNGLLAREITPELARLMFRAGFKTINLGLEGISSQLLRASDEKINKEIFLETLRILKKSGYEPEQIGVYLLTGLPGQKVEEVLESIIFAHLAGCRIKLAEFSPVPATQEYEKAKLFCGNLQEPLMHNKLAFSLYSKQIDYIIYERIKRFTKKLNKNIGRCLSISSLLKEVGLRRGF